MKSVSKIALGVALALGGLSLVATAPAAAKEKKEEAKPKAVKLSKEERTAIAALQKAVNAKDWAAANAALPAAKAAAQGPDAKYLTGAMQLNIGVGTNNVALQAEAIDMMIASGGADASALPQLYKNQGALASNAGDYAKAEVAFTKWVELAPNDPEAVVILAETKNSLNKSAEGVALLQKAIDLKKASGAQVPESWYKRGLKLAYDGQLGPQSVQFSRELIGAYPTTENWRDALLIYREVTKLDQPTTIDTLRLMRAAKALNGERDFFELADALNDRGLPAESKAVLNEGIAQKMVDPNKPAFKELLALVGRRITEDRTTPATLEKEAQASAKGTAALSAGDVFYGTGDFAKAAALYKLALQKGSVDANIVNSRLGMALAQSGDKAGAEAAFKAVTGPRADLAGFWLLWLAQQG